MGLTRPKLPQDILKIPGHKGFQPPVFHQLPQPFGNTGVVLHDKDPVHNIPP